MTEKITNLAGAGGGCFRAGSLVQLPHGQTKPIEQIQEGDIVLAFDEAGVLHEAPVLRLHIHEDPQPIIKVKFWRGDVSLTPNHWVLNQYNSFVEVGSMTMEDAFVDGMGHLRPLTGCEYVAHEPVYNLTVEQYHTFICNGIRVHNGGHRERFPVAGAGGGGGGGGKGGGGGRPAQEDPDTLQSLAKVSIVDVIGEGPIGGLVNGARSIFLNDVPLMNQFGGYNFTHASFEDRLGTQDQAPIQGYSEIETPTALGLKIEQATPQTIALTDTNTDRVKVIMAVPSLISQNRTTGDVHGSEVKFRFLLSTNSGPFEGVTVGYDLFPGGADYDIPTNTVSIRPEFPQRSGLSFNVKGPSFTLAEYESAIGNASFIIFQPEYLKSGFWLPYGAPLKLELKDVRLNSGQIDVNSMLAQSSVKIEIPNTRSVRLSIMETSGVWAGKLFFNITDIQTAVPNEIVTIKGKTRSRYQRSFNIPLPKSNIVRDGRFGKTSGYNGENTNTWVLKVERISPDSPDSSVQNDLFIDSYSQVIDARLSYPNTALIGVTVNSEQFSSVPKRAYLVDGLLIKVPSNYNPVTRRYDGIWNGTFKLAISDNPAWIMYDLLLKKRYGLGEFIEPHQVDKATLYQIGRYCDGMVSDGRGGFEPRFTVNTVVQTQAEAYQLVSDIASVFRGMTFWNGGMVGFSSDAPQDPVIQYTNANVIDGLFEYSGSSRKDRHSVIHVIWNDPADQYRQRIEYVEDSELVQKFGVRKLELISFGCTSRAMAHRVGLWALYTEKSESDVVVFTVGPDSLTVEPGNIVKIHDRYRAGKRLGGRIKSITETSATLDAPVQFGINSTVAFRLPNGDLIERSLVTPSGETSTISWTAPLTELPLVGSIYIIAEPSLKPMLARVVSVAQGDKQGTVQISAVQHNPEKYAAIEEGLILEEPVTSIISEQFLKTPTNFQVDEAPYEISPGNYGIKLDVSWEGDSQFYDVTYRRVNPDPTNIIQRRTTVAGISLENVVYGTYEFTVVGANYANRQTERVTYSYEVLHPGEFPPDVLNLELFEPWIGRTVRLQWDTVVLAKGYRIEVFSGMTKVRTDFSPIPSYEYSRDMAAQDGGPYRNLTFKVSAVSYSNTFSVTPAELTVSNPQIGLVNGLEVIPTFLSFELEYARPADVDFEGIVVHLGEVPDFIPDETNRVFEGDGFVRVSTDGAGIPLTKGDYYVRVAGYDSFGKDNLTFSNALKVTPLAIVDGVNPGEITAVLIANGAIDITKFAPGEEPMGVVLALPDPIGYMGPQVVYLKTDGKLYRLVDGVWKREIAAGDVVGFLGADQIGSGVIDPTKTKIRRIQIY